MTAVDEILSQVSRGDLAARLGVDEATAERAARQALPALLGGIQANAEDPAGAASFARAVQQHDGGLIDGGVDLSQVDTSDGDRIVGHVFGSQRDQVVNQLGGIGPLGAAPDARDAQAAQDAQGALGGLGGSGLISTLLPLLAPIVMSYLAKKMGGGAAGSGSLPGAGAGAGGGLGDLLGGILGGGGKSGGPLGGGLGDLLGGLLGGGRK